MANKRISRSRKRELDQPDEFVSFSGKVLNYITEHKKEIITFSSVFIGIIICAVGFRYYSSHTEAKAYSLLEEGIKKYNSVRETNDPQKIFSEVKEDFEHILNRYSGKKASKIACLMFADISYDAGEMERAIALYEQSLKKFDKNAYYRQLVYNNLAYAYEQINEYDKAIEYMEKIVAGSILNFKEDALYNLARLYAAKGQTDKERECYRKIQDDFPNSLYSNIAKEKLKSML